MIMIDMEIPKSCYTCPCTNTEFYLCMVGEPKQLEDDCEERRPQWCPLGEVKRGKWLNRGRSMECSVCGHHTPFTVRNYCPSCGAKMEESEPS